MGNDKTQITWNYHNGTKHPNGIFLIKPHFYDPALRPVPYKIYKTLKGVPISCDRHSTSPAIKSISEFIVQNESDNLLIFKALVIYCIFQVELQKQ